MSSKVRVVHFWQSYTPGLFDRTHEMCLSHNYQSQIVCSQLIDNGQPPPKELYYCSKWAGKSHSSNSLYYRILRKLFAIAEGYQFRYAASRAMKNFKPNIVHMHFGHTALNLFNVIKYGNCPKIISFYGADISSGLESKRNIQLYKKIFANDTTAIVLCNAARDRLLNIGAKPSQIHIWNIPPGIEQYPLRARKYDGITKFLMAARFVEKKGHHYALHAFRNLLNERKDIYLTFYGYGPSESVQRSIEELKMSSHCHVINNKLSSNFNTEYNKLLSEHDVFLAPSIRAKNGDDEGGPALTMVLAQSAGLPVICTNFPGHELSFIDNETGFLCKPNDVESLKIAMDRMCNRPDLWSEMGKKAHNITQSEFSERSQSDKLIKIYEQTERQTK